MSVPSGHGVYRAELRHIRSTKISPPEGITVFLVARLTVDTGSGICRCVLLSSKVENFHVIHLTNRPLLVMSVDGGKLKFPALYSSKWERNQ